MLIDIAKAAQYDDNDDYWTDEPPVGMCFNYGDVDEYMWEGMIRKQEITKKTDKRKWVFGM